MTENIQQAKIHFESKKYEIALQFLDKELERNSNVTTNDICYYKGIVLTYIGKINKEKFRIESGIQHFEKLIATENFFISKSYPEAEDKLKWAKVELRKLEL